MKIREIFITIIIITVGILLFLGYMDFVTYKGELAGEHFLYVKMDGRTGSVQKVNNRYLKKSVFIKNIHNLPYGFYTIRYDIREVQEKNGFRTLEGKMLGYRGSLLNGLRKHISDMFDELFITEDNLHAFSKAAILGEKAEVSRDMNDKFKYTGLAHLIVISGTHISLVIMGIVKMFDMMSLKYRFKYIGALMVLSLYCTLIGMSPGVMRAYIMGAMMLLARIMFEKENGKKSLIISLVIILVLNPYSLFDISMQLSYMAVVAIIFIYPSVESVAEAKLLYKLKEGIVKDSIKLIILSFVIQLTSIPLFMYYFKKLPLFSFIINIVGVPIGTVLVQVLFGIFFVNLIGLKIMNIVLIPLVRAVYYAFEGFVYFGNNIPLLQVNTGGKIDIISVAVYYMALITVKMYMDSLLMKDTEKIANEKKRV